MRTILVTLAAAAALFIGAAFAPAPAAQADECMSPPPSVPLVQIEDAAACGGGTGLLAQISHTDEWGFLHWDCIYYSDWPYPRMWMVHGC